MKDYIAHEITMFKNVLNRYAKVNGIQVEGSYYDYLNGRVVNEESVEKGLTITVDGVNFDVLQTRSDVDEQVNSNSMVVRARYESQDGLKKFLILNDVSRLSGNRLLEKYGDELKSDVVQLSHHGQAGATKEVYDVIGAKIRLWPTPYWVWSNPIAYEIGKVRDWFGISDKGDSENDLIACLYEEYPEDRTCASDWKKCIDKMMIEI